MPPAVRLLLMSSLWMLSLTLLIVRTVMHDWASLAVLSIWAIWIEVVAALITGAHLLACLLIRERARIESVAEQAAEVAIRHAGLDSIG